MKGGCLLWNLVAKDSLLTGSLRHNDFHGVYSSLQQICRVECLYDFSPHVYRQFFDGGVHNWQHDTIIEGHDESRAVLAHQDHILCLWVVVRIHNLQIYDIGFGRAQKVFVEAFANDFDVLLDLSKIQNVSIVAEVTGSQQSDADRVVVPMESFSKALVGDKVGGVEFEIWFLLQYAKRSMMMRLL